MWTKDKLGVFFAECTVWKLTSFAKGMYPFSFYQFFSAWKCVVPMNKTIIFQLGTVYKGHTRYCSWEIPFNYFVSIAQCIFSYVWTSNYYDFFCLFILYNIQLYGCGIYGLDREILIDSDKETAKWIHVITLQTD